MVSFTVVALVFSWLFSTPWAAIRVMTEAVITVVTRTFIFTTPASSPSLLLVWAFFISPLHILMFASWILSPFHKCGLTCHSPPEIFLLDFGHIEAVCLLQPLLEVLVRFGKPLISFNLLTSMVCTYGLFVIWLVSMVCTCGLFVIWLMYLCQTQWNSQWLNLWQRAQVD